MKVTIYMDLGIDGKGDGSCSKEEIQKKEGNNGVELLRNLC